LTFSATVAVAVNAPSHKLPAVAPTITHARCSLAISAAVAAISSGIAAPPVPTVTTASIEASATPAAVRHAILAADSAMEQRLVADKNFGR
jgi:hypothetical protein